LLPVKHFGYLLHTKNKNYLISTGSNNRNELWELKIDINFYYLRCWRYENLYPFRCVIVGYLYDSDCDFKHQLYYFICEKEFGSKFKHSLTLNLKTIDESLTLGCFSNDGKDGIFVEYITGPFQKYYRLWTSFDQGVLEGLWEIESESCSDLDMNRISFLGK